MWHQSGSDDWLLWDEAKEWVLQLNCNGYAGYQNWRLPTLEEAVSLLESSMKNGGLKPHLNIDPVFSKKQKWILTGDKLSSEASWCVYIDCGRVVWRNDNDLSMTVRPVRSVE